MSLNLKLCKKVFVAALGVAGEESLVNAFTKRSVCSYLKVLESTTIEGDSPVS